MVQSLPAKALPAIIVLPEDPPEMPAMVAAVLGPDVTLGTMTRMLRLDTDEATINGLKQVFGQS